MTLQPPPHISLLDISKEIQAAILSKMNRYYWIKAEISKLNFYRQSGHCYPQLVEKKGGQVVAEIRTTIWANDYRAIQQKFLKVTGTELTDGMTILCYARVNYHPVYGLSLQISDIDPSVTLGEMALERTRTIERLKREGLWDRNRSIALPQVPQRLAVISVETSKGYHDFRNIIDNNGWGYAFFQMLFPALLQGDKAVDSIGNQLDLIASIKHHFDAVLIIRGGGGDVGLSCFDHYNLASKVANFPLPVISGIGHSTNETVVEMVSHTNSITPTDLAYGLIQYYHNFSVKTENLAERLNDEVTAMVGQERRRLDESAMRVISSSRLFTERNKALLNRIASHAGMIPLQRIRDGRRATGLLKEQVVQGISQRYRRDAERLDMYQRHVLLLDPVNVLQRGYSIVRHHGKAVKASGEVKPGDELEVTLYKGKIITQVQHTENTK
jgi:exodeoxyribonuclease VII large subunit